MEDSKMVTVAKDFFFEGLVLPVAVFLRMKPGHYLLIGKPAEKADFLDLHSFKNPEVPVYIKDLDHSDFIDYFSTLTAKLVSSKGVSVGTKSKFLQGLTDEALLAFAGKNFTSTAQLQKVSSMLKGFTQSVSGFDQVIEILMNLPNTESKHTMATTMICLSICDEMKITLPLAQEKLALGALLHDVGLTQVPRSILDKARHLWTPDEILIYEQHPIKGVEMLRDLKDITHDILMMVVEHHENSQGTGFPKRIRDVKISPFGKILIVANYFANLLISPKELGANYSADDAIRYMDDVIGQPFNKQAFLALRNIVNKNYLKEKI